MMRSNKQSGIFALAAIMSVLSQSIVFAQNKTTPKRVTGVRFQDFGVVDASVGGDLLSFTAENNNTSIGITVAPTDSVLRSQLHLKKGGYGVVVTRVLAKSPAAKAGIRAHDIILSATGTGIAAGSDLIQVIRKAGKKPLDLSLLRGGKKITVHIRPAPIKDLQATFTAEYTLLYKLKIGVNTNPVSQELIAQLVLPPKTGLVVTDVTAKSPAEAAGLQKYDVILKVGDGYVKSSTDLWKAVDKLGGKTVVIEFIRTGRRQTCTVKPVKRPNTSSSLWYRVSDFVVPNDRSNRIWSFHLGTSRYGTGVDGVSNAITWADSRHQGRGVQAIQSKLDAMLKQLKSLQISLSLLNEMLEAQSKPKPKSTNPKKK